MKLEPRTESTPVKMVSLPTPALSATVLCPVPAARIYSNSGQREIVVYARIALPVIVSSPPIPSNWLNVPPLPALVLLLAEANGRVGIIELRTAD